MSARIYTIEDRRPLGAGYNQPMVRRSTRHDRQDVRRMLQDGMKVMAICAALNLVPRQVTAVKGKMR